MAKLWWLSFRDPQSNTLLGVAIVSASSFEGAIKQAWSVGVNPGGETLSREVPQWAASVLRQYENKLLTKEQAKRLADAVDTVAGQLAQQDQIVYPGRQSFFRLGTFDAAVDIKHYQAGILKKVSE